MPPTPRKTITAYHQATKHHFQRYARSLGHLDWATQPAPFRRFHGTETIALGLPDAPLPEDLTWDSLFGPDPAPEPVTRAHLGRLFYHSLALSAWKEVTDPQGRVVSRWALRVNPSSGNLHPTEGYLITGPVPGLDTEPGVFHYAPDEHLLERRARLADGDHAELQKILPAGSFLVGLTSIHWREAWKYGERAFRYCQHDVGHAVAALAVSARALGWSLTLLSGLEHQDIAAVLGTALQTGPEKEDADCLLLVTPGPPPGLTEVPGLGAALARAGQRAAFTGTPNTLSSSHHDWPIIEEAATACREALAAPLPPLAAASPADDQSERGLAAGTIIRNRRSAVSLDSETGLDRDTFTLLLRRLLPDRTAVPYRSLGLAPQVSLILFIHRVADLEPGLYCLVRHPDHEASLRRHFRTDFSWQKAPLPGADLPLFQLATGDTRNAARQLSCGQDIAADGAFSVGMLARFDHNLEKFGAGFYPRLFWETGVIGQMLYLEAEAAGIRGTGIGCFFDDEVHRVLGLEDTAWQSLYHFTVGGPVDDGRLRTAAPYEHLED